MPLALIAAAALAAATPPVITVIHLPPPPAGCRVDRALEVTPAAAQPAPNLGPHRLGDLPPAREVRAVRRLVNGCDYAEVRTGQAWTLKSDRQIHEEAAWPHGR